MLSNASASPATCGNANWGDVSIINTLHQEVAIEMISKNYENLDADNIDADVEEIFVGIPSGNLHIKVYDAKKTKLIKEFDAVVTSCKETLVTIQ
jgi:hypothetical protein